MLIRSPFINHFKEKNINQDEFCYNSEYRRKHMVFLVSLFSPSIKIVVLGVPKSHNNIE